MTALPIAATPMRTVSATVPAAPFARMKAAPFQDGTAMTEAFTAATAMKTAFVTEAVSKSMPLSEADTVDAMGTVKIGRETVWK